MRTRARVGPRSKTAAAQAEPAMRILVATAGDSDSRGALRIAGELAATRHADVLAVAVAPPFPHGTSIITPDSPAVFDETSRREMLARLTRRVNAVAGSETWTRRAVVGWPSDRIARIAEEWNASLIVLGLAHHKGLDRIFGGETTVAVAREATHPVLAVAPRARCLPSKAVVAIDFTPESIAAAKLAASLLSADGGLTLVHVSAFHAEDVKPGGLSDIYRAGAEAKLEDALNAVRGTTHAFITTKLLEGEPADSLLDFATSSKCDLIAMGGHLQGLVDRFLLGSVRTRVLRGASCSVLIVPPARR